MSEFTYTGDFRELVVHRETIVFTSNAILAVFIALVIIGLFVAIALDGRRQRAREEAELAAIRKVYSEQRAQFIAKRDMGVEQ